jgi:hypothetical protein
MDKGLRAIPVGIVIVYAVIVLALCNPGMAAFGTLLLTYTQSMVSVWLMVGLCALLVTTVRQHREGTPGSAWGIANDFLRSRWREDRLVSLFLPLFCFVLLITVYNLFKALYLPSAGFWAGRYIARGERAMLGGHDAWQLTHGMLASPWATQAIDLCYHGWFLPMVVGVAICSFVRPDSRLGWRYLTSYLLLWSVQGNLVAYLLPAAGPALHGSMHPGSSRFDALNATLNSQDAFLRAHGAPGLYSLEYQRGLVALFGQPSVAIGGGISAMPSLHNAMAVLFACAAWSIGRRAGIAATLYALLIWFGSVHLGWHYALDGIVACALTVSTWVGVGRVPALFERRRTAQLSAAPAEPVVQPIIVSNDWGEPEPVLAQA